MIRRSRRIGAFQIREANTPTPSKYRDICQGEDIVHTISNNRQIYDVGSPYPGGGEASKGWAVRPLKRYASWVQTVVRQVGPYLLQAWRFERSSS